MVSRTPTLADAYARCQRLAREHYENFPVASRLLPARMRPHVAALYAFARIADDFADEGERTPEERERLLDEWHSRLRRCVDRTPTPRPGDPHSLVFTALGETIRTCGLPVALFEDLLSAFRQDITTHRYATFAELVEYCRRSANPVGRLVLRIAGHDDPALDAGSDCLCSALQMTNFWQDLERDWARGRLYVPAEVREAAGADESALSAGRLTPQWEEALSVVAARTRELFARGRTVCDGVRGRLRLELRLTWLGGRRLLDRLEKERFDVFRHRPALGAADLPALLWQAIMWTGQD
jgi:hydroxysqualene synthase